MTAFTINREVDLPSEKLFSIISDFTRPPSPTIPIDVEKIGDKDSGVGTIRTITIGMVKVRERLESVNPPDSFTYTILSGVPLKDYLGTVKILPKESKSEIHWSVKFTSKIPFTDWLSGIISKKTINRLIDETEANNR